MKLYIHSYFRIVVLVLISIPFFVGYPSTINPSVLPLSVGSPLFESPHTSPIVVNDKFVYVTNTPSGTVDVIDKEKHTVFTRIAVGVDPVSLAVRPDGKEVWVSNHISDSVNVIDTDPESWSYHQVVATIQDIDP